MSLGADGASPPRRVIAYKEHKRVRTIFKPEQLERLEAQFQRQQFLVGTERSVYSTRLYVARLNGNYHFLIQ